MYEARNQFYNNQLFGYFDGFGVLTFDQCASQYQQANPDVDVTERIGYAWLLDNDGNMLAYTNGNSWSEYIFNAAADDAVVERFLEVYNWMIGDEGVRLAYFGREGIDYVFEGETLVSIREIDSETGLVIPFNRNGEMVKDWVSPVFPGALVDSRIGFLNPAYSDFSKETVRHYWDLRNGYDPLKVIEFDLNLALFSGDYYSKYSLKPQEAIGKIIFEESADGVEAAWNTYVTENAAQVDNILNELNAGR